MNELNTKKRENSLVNKYSYKHSSTLDGLVERSAYLNAWKEIINSPMGKIHILLQFSQQLEPTDQIYSNIANELYLSNVNAQIVKQKENYVIIQLNDIEKIQENIE